MVIPTLCLVAAIFMGWVILLETVVAGLKEENDALRKQLDKREETAMDGVTLGEGRRSASKTRPELHKSAGRRKW